LGLEKYQRLRLRSSAAGSVVETLFLPRTICVVSTLWALLKPAWSDLIKLYRLLTWVPFVHFSTLFFTFPGRAKSCHLFNFFRLDAIYRFHFLHSFIFTFVGHVRRPRLYKPHNFHSYHLPKERGQSSPYVPRTIQSRLAPGLTPNHNLMIAGRSFDFFWSGH